MERERERGGEDSASGQVRVSEMGTHEGVELLILSSAGGLPLEEGGQQSSTAVHLACAQALGVRPRDVELFKLKRIHRTSEQTLGRNRVAAMVKKGKNKRQSRSNMGTSESSSDAFGTVSFNELEQGSEALTENDFLHDKMETLEDALLAFQDLSSKLQTELARKEKELESKTEQVRHLEQASHRERKEAERWKKKYERAMSMGSIASAPKASPNTKRSSRTVPEMARTAPEARMSPARRRSLVSLEPVPYMTCRMCSCAQFVARKDVRWICSTCQHTVVKHVQRPSVHETKRATSSYGIGHLASPALVGRSSSGVYSFPRRSISAPKTDYHDFEDEELFPQL